MNRQNKEYNKTEYALIFVRMLLLWAGFCLVVLPGFPSLNNLVAYLAGGAAAGIAFLVIHANSKKVYILAAGGCICLILLASAARTGILTLISDAIGDVAQVTGKIYMNYGEGEDLGLSTALAGGILTLFISFGLTECAIRRSKWIAALYTLLLGIGCGLGIFTAGPGLIIWVTGLLMLLPERGGRRFLLLFAAPAAAAALAAAVCLLLPKTLSQSVKLEARQLLHELRYEKSEQAMPEGDLKNLGGFQKNSDVKLQITMEAPQKVYLRGMVSDVYTGIRWKETDPKDIEEQTPLFYWLHKNGFYSAASVAQAQGLALSPKAQTMTIRNLSACGKYAYLPYALADSSVLDPKQNGDGSVAAVSNEQTLFYYEGSVPTWYDAQHVLAGKQYTKEVSDYLSCEEAYRAYVYEHDLQLTNAAVGVLNRMLGTNKKSRTLGDIQDLIRETVEEKLTYSESAVTMNGSNDFFQYVLEQTKAGYSVHYATAAVLMFRYLGVPARYAEGYFLSADEAAKYAAEDVISLTAEHAHAWAEYYLDGIGWIPFEVTPGYVDDEDMMADEESAESGSRSFTSSGLIFSQPEYSPAQEQLQKIKKHMRFDMRYLLYLLLLIVLLLIIRFIVSVLKKRKKLLTFLADMEKADNRNAITMQYGYAMMLIKKCGKIPEIASMEAASAINTEARFSNHEMSDEQRHTVENFACEVKEAVLKCWSGKEKMKYHFIDWIYR